MHRLLKIVEQVIYTAEEQQRSKHRALRDAHPLAAVPEKVTDPSVCIVLDTISVEFK